MLVNQDDRIALRWLLGYGSSNFRAPAYQRIREHCTRTGETPWNVLAQLDNGTISIPYTSQLVTRFREIQTALAPLQAETDLDGLVRAWLPAGDPELETFRALVSTVRPIAQTASDLRDAIIAAVARPEIPPEVTQVRIMSLHKSKGLSSPVVVIAGCVEGLLPARPDESASISQQRADLEEQRRLFYVGLTRVKAEPATNRQGALILTSSRIMPFATARSANIVPAAEGRLGDVHLVASRFIGELGPAAPLPRRG